MAERERTDSERLDTLIELGEVRADELMDYWLDAKQRARVIDSDRWNDPRFVIDAIIDAEQADHE